MPQNTKYGNNFKMMIVILILCGQIIIIIISHTSPAADSRLQGEQIIDTDSTRGKGT